MRRLLAMAATLMLPLTTAAPAMAGGWAVTSFEEAPGSFVAGESYRLRYVILQHGRTPFQAEHTAVILRSSEEALTFEGEATGDPGTYVAEIEVPWSGSWVWEVAQEPFEPHRLGKLVITAPPGNGSFSQIPWLLLGLLLAAGALAGAALIAVRATVRSASPPAVGPG